MLSDARKLVFGLPCSANWITVGLVVLTHYQQVTDGHKDGILLFTIALCLSLLCMQYSADAG